MIFGLILFSGCNLPQTLPSEVQSLPTTVTIQAIAVQITQSPTVISPVVLHSPVPPASVTAFIQAGKTSTPQIISVKTQRPTQICDLALAGTPIDVTIPDDTRMQPNQSFTKIWRLRNAGACTWSKDYSIAFFSGERMGASKSIPIPHEVPPGESVDISVDMTSPKDSGKFQGNWKLLNNSDKWFGIGPNGSAAFWVRIVVQQPPSETPTSRPPQPTLEPTATEEPIVFTATQTVTPTMTPTVEATFTATPVVTMTASASAVTTLAPGDQLDLDKNQLNPDRGADLALVVDQAGQHLLAPLGNTLIGIFGTTKPDFDDCRNNPKAPDAVNAEQLPAGAYLCFRTENGVPGWLQEQGFPPDSSELNVRYITWFQQ